MPVYPSSLIRDFVVRLQNPMNTVEYSSEQINPWSDCMDTACMRQAASGLRCDKDIHCLFPRDTAQLCDHKRHCLNCVEMLIRAQLFKSNIVS